MTAKVANSPGQLLKGDCLNVTETRLGPVKACLAMPWVYVYLASFVMTCKTTYVQQNQHWMSSTIGMLQKQASLLVFENFF